MVKLRLKIGEKGQILIPKLFREKYGIKEGEEVTMELREEGLFLKGRPSKEDVLASLKEHAAKLRSKGIAGSRLGDLKALYLEMEYEVASR